MSHGLQLTLCLIHAVMVIGIGMGIAHLKNRSLWAGFLWPFFLGFIGLIILLCLPKKDSVEAPPGSMREQLREQQHEGHS